MFNVEFEEVTNQFCAEFDTVVHTGDAELGEKIITANGVYNASSDDLDGYSKVTANVPNTYTASDEGKVVDNGALVSQTSATYTSNDTYDTTKINSVTVNVSGGGDTPVIDSLSVTPTTSQQTFNESGVDGYKPVVVAAMPTGTEGTPTATKGTVSNHAVAVTPSVTNQAGYIDGGTKTGTAVTVSASELDSGTKSITANGSNQDVVGYAAVDVTVPNSYSAADEGKVVSNGALVAQTAHADVTPTTSDQTIDTTTNNSIKVKGDADLVAANIKKDVEIFGVTGSYEGGGGGKTNIDIGIQNTPIPSILNMFYALESGTAATGQYTPAQALPNTDTELFDTGLATVHGLFIADESQDILNTANTPDGLLFGIVFNPSYDDTGTSDYSGYTYACSRDTIAMQNTKNGVGGRFVSRGSWTITNGKFIFKSAFNRNDNYCPFRSSHTYRWVAW